MAKQPKLDMSRAQGDLRPATVGQHLSISDWAAWVLSALWLLVVGATYLFAPDTQESTSWGAKLTGFVTLILPIALIWVATTTMRAARGMRDEAHRLHASIDAMRQAYLSKTHEGLARPSVEKKLDEIVAAQRQTETAIATFTSRRDSASTVLSADRKTALIAPKPALPSDEQPGLALGTPAESLQDPVTLSDFIKALNFPDNPDDVEGFRALRRTLSDRNVAKLIRAAQDVLTLLSQDGIYMDDLRPDRARPDIWRRFAQGERGRAMAPLGGVRDRSSLALTAGRMRQDTVFRDAAHHFLRQFDKTLVEFEQNASEAEVAELAETRTARAFMLLGRVTGMFD